MRKRSTVYGDREEMMAKADDRPFSNIESAYQYVSLLREALDDAYHSVEGDIVEALRTPDSQRRVDALRVVSLKLHELRRHLLDSLVLLNDLRTLRRLLLGERDQAAIDRESGNESDQV